eukprot:GILI01001585.1.p1 GENE.GILI01001585.1~~GILI01001585.1.p1  ORF type:complete len:760 (-),score=244.65 GILI01001585.1:190-2130(-)
MQRMMFIRCLRPDKLMDAVQDFVTAKLGEQFIKPPQFDLGTSYKDSTNMTPLIFILSPGADPFEDWKKFAETQRMSKKLSDISLGQGQGPRAKQLFEDGLDNGKWVLLQNCHLATSWMPELERLVEGMSTRSTPINPQFRLWLTSMPDSHFPVAILQNGVKMTNEPPKGLRANLVRSYVNLDDKELNDCKKPEAFKKLLFGFCFFHAVVQERRKFGPIGWNIPYEFTNEDLTVCKRQLKLFLDDYAEIPYKVLNYLGAEINYGGRVTDDKDGRLICTILHTYITGQVFTDEYKFSDSGLYYAPGCVDQKSFLDFIRGLPLNPSPEVFGLHDNAEITTAQNETRIMLETILALQPRASAGAGKSREETIMHIADSIASKTPEVFDLDKVASRFPTMYAESMNTVLLQEVIRYNRLLAVMKRSLAELKKAIKGLVVMSDDLEKMSNSLFDNQVPALWAKQGFLSLKPLASWIKDLNDRIVFLDHWIKDGTPKCFWISGFFFPQAFLTGTLQNYSRKHVVAIDKLFFEYKFMDRLTLEDIKERPADGCYIHGMFMEGARWDPETHAIADSRPKELYTEMPIIWLHPTTEKPNYSVGYYECPVYKVLSRSGTLSTTGHSTNYVMYMPLPSKHSKDKWIKAGVACFLALRY